MNYLRNEDFRLLIQDQNLQQIISNDQTILDSVEIVAVEEITSYLSQRYDTKTAFKNIQNFGAAIAYKKGDIIDLTAPPYAINTTYLANTLVLSGGNIFKALQTVINITPINDNVNWKLISKDQTLFYAILDSTGNYPDNTTYWTQGDNRYQLLVVYAVDIAIYHLLSRISPRNIPQLRIDRYESAKNHLDKIARGNINVELATLAPIQGSRIVFGGNAPITHFY